MTSKTPIDSVLFRRLLGNFATGITVVTTLDEAQQPYGLTVNSFTSVSLEPPLILVCLDRELSGLGHFEKTGRFAVNILGEGQQALSNHFATKGTDRSQGLSIDPASGLPVIPDALAVLYCELWRSYDGGDHSILVGQVAGGLATSERNPLIYFQGRYRTLSP